MSEIALLPMKPGRLAQRAADPGIRDEGQILTASPENHDQAGLLDAAGLVATVESELARAARHELPLVLVMLEVSGPGLTGMDFRDRVEQAVMAGLGERIRAEDRAARLGPLKYAVLAVETDESEALAAGLAEHVKRSLARLGPEGTQLFVTTGAVDCQYDELTSQELLQAAERALSAAGHTGLLRKSA